MTVLKLCLEFFAFLFWAFIVLVVGCCLALSSRADELLEGEEPAAGNQTSGKHQSRDA